MTVDKKHSAGFRKPVKVIETGEVFESRAAAARAIGCSACSIYEALKRGTPIEGFHLMDFSNDQETA